MKHETRQDVAIPLHIRSLTSGASERPYDGAIFLIFSDMACRLLYPEGVHFLKESPKMNDNSLAGDPVARSGTWPSLRSESHHPAFVRRMAARLALEAMRIEKTARVAAHEVWEESTRPHRLPGPAARAI